MGFLAAAWLLFAPAGLPGGSASYLVSSGKSMLPLLERGDLVLAREATSYEVDDVVAYRSRTLQRLVLHRIVRVDGDRYVMKGDNNAWLDTERPAKEDIVGEMWLRVPSGGQALTWMRTPRNSAAVAAVAGLIVFGGLRGKKARRRRKGHRTDNPGAAPKRRAPAIDGRRMAWWAVLAVAVALLACSAFAVAAFTRPETKEIAVDVGYQHLGTFGYSGPTSSSLVYGRPSIESGDPVFLNVSKGVSARFEYGFDTQTPHAISGTIRLGAELGDATGWKRDIELGPPSGFTGDAGVVEERLDLASLKDLTLEVQAATGITRPSFTLRLVADVDIEGTVAGREVDESFHAELPFLLEALVLYPEAPPGADGEAADPFEHSQRGSVRITELVPNRISVPGLSVDVASARRVSVIASLALLGALVLPGSVLLLRRPRDEPSRIEARYGRRLIPVGRSDTLVDKTVEVRSIEALVQVADAYERMILYEETDGDHSYFVEGDVVIYAYRTTSAPARRAEPESSPASLQPDGGAPAAEPETAPRGGQNGPSPSPETQIEPSLPEEVQGPPPAKRSDLADEFFFGTNR